MNEWEFGENLSEETKNELFQKLKKIKNMTDEEADDYFNRELRGSYLELIREVV